MTGRAWLCALALVTAATIGAPASAAPADGAPAVAAAPALAAEHVEGQVVVRFDDSMSDTVKEAALSIARVGSSPLARAGDAVVLQTEPGQSVESAVAALRPRAAVRYAEPNYLWRTSTVPNDARLGDQWSLRSTGQTVNGASSSPDADIDAPEAWDLTTGGADVVVAIVDSGVAYDHPDLAANMWSNPGESGGGRENNGVDDDHNGYVDDYRGWDVVGASRASAVDSDNDPRDILGHGTHVAGTIGAVGDNGIGVAGVAWRVRLMPVRVFDGEGVATSADIAEGFAYAGDNGARIVNYSGGGASFSQAVQDAITSHPNTLYVVAAGNEGRDLDAVGNNTYPCELPPSNIVCVAATTQTDSLAGFTNYSEASVDLAAPGTNILSTYPAFGPTLWSENFETDPFSGGSPRWTKGAAPGSVNTWAVTSQYSPGSGSSVTDSPPLGVNYPNNHHSWIQTSTATNLAGQRGCRLQYPAYIATEFGFDQFYISGRTNTGFDNGDVLRAWWGTGGVADIVDLSRFDGGPLYLRFGLSSDSATAGDGVYIDDMRINCVSSTYSSGGASELAYLSGTSMATPHVAGVAALVVSRAPSLGTAALRSVLVETGDQLPGLSPALGKTASGRRLNAFAAVSAATDTSYHPLSPSRVVDTRLAPLSVVGAGAQLDVALLGRGGVPLSGVGAVVLNVTATDAQSSGYVTVWPGGEGRPRASSLNFVAGQPVANVVVAKLGAGGVVSFWNADDSPAMGSVNLLIDVVGWFGSGSSFTALSPSRVVDTRLAPLSVVGAGAQLDVALLGRGGVPLSGVGAVVLNVTATDAQSSGYVTVWPGGEGRPRASSLNFVAGQPVANVVVAKLGAGGVVSFWNADDSPAMGSVNLLIDVVGWFGSGSSFTALSPSRVVDTRLAPLSVVGAGAQLDVALLGRGGVPLSGVGAVVLNVTATDAQSSGYVTVWPGGEGRPRASSLNFVAGQPVANVVVAKLGAGGVVSFWNADDSPAMGSVNLLIDVVGWFAT